MTPRSLAFGAARFVAELACATGLVVVVGLVLLNLVLDADDAWDGSAQRTQFFHGLRFEEAYRAAEEGDSWRAGLEALDPEALSRSVGTVGLPPLFLASPARYRLVVDGSARVAALFEPRAPSAELLADGRTASVWCRELVRDLRDAGDDLAWLADDPRVDWRAVEERP